MFASINCLLAYIDIQNGYLMTWVSTRISHVSLNDHMHVMILCYTFIIHDVVTYGLLLDCAMAIKLWIYVNMRCLNKQSG